MENLDMIFKVAGVICFVLLTFIAAVYIASLFRRSRDKAIVDAKESARRLRELMPGDDDPEKGVFAPLDRSLAREAVVKGLHVDKKLLPAEHNVTIDTSDDVEDAINSMGGPRL